MTELRKTDRLRLTDRARCVFTTLLFACGAVLSFQGIADGQDAPRGALRPVVQDKEAKSQGTPTTVSTEQIDRWIEQLSDDHYAVREEAAERLLENGQHAKDALRKGCGSDNPETAWRCQKILDQLDDARDGDRSPLRLWKRSFENPQGRRFEGFGEFDGADLEAWIQKLFEESDEGPVPFQRSRIREFQMPDLQMPDLEGLFEDLGAELETFLGQDIEEWIDQLGKDVEKLTQHQFHTEVWENGKKVFERSFDSNGDGSNSGDLPESFQQARLGVKVEKVSAVLATHLGLEAGQGLVIERVLPGSVADRAGLEVHDILVTVGDQDIGSIAALRRAIHDQVEIEAKIIRKGTETNVNLRFSKPEKSGK